MKNTKFWGVLLALILAVFTALYQTKQVNDLESQVGKRDTVLVQGEVTHDSVAVHDTIVVHHNKYVKVIDSVNIPIYRPMDFLDSLEIAHYLFALHQELFYDSSRCFGSVKFSDSTNKFTNVDAKVYWPSGQVNLTYFNKFNLIGYDRRMKFHFGGGYANKFGAFAYVNAMYKQNQLGIMSGQNGLGFYFGRSFR